MVHFNLSTRPHKQWRCEWGNVCILSYNHRIRNLWFAFFESLTEPCIAEYDDVFDQNNLHIYLFSYSSVHIIWKVRF